MNIAHLLPNSAKFPLVKHNGRYEWVLRLALLQAQAGHTVTIYSAPDSGKNLPDIHWRSLPRNMGDKNLNNQSLIEVAFAEPSHDIFHSHFDFLHFQLAHKTSKPVIATQHWFPNEKISQAAQNSTKRVLAVPPTRFMLEANKRMSIPSAEVIYHGIDLDRFHPSENTASERLIFVGRITPSKGVLQAVKLALQTGEKLDIVGKVNGSDQAYWDKISPMVDNQSIRYLGPKNQEEVAELFAQAKAFLFPSRHIEAFGQVIVESQATGTPVITSNIGAANELIVHGKTGFLADSTQDFITAIQNISQIKRENCRKFAEKFDMHDMVKSYENLYRQLLSSV